ncbi:hypothetical protein DXG03_000474 [Asterophora parasitica]|uniref:Uncharacterized protein n=1 Tax=Asterophora parasitica TaxID=117018 RepID=A0A9P7GEW6_9AGAR|nr:hypothetical protein DXG03_000474 [Asterophora parasitica]
MYVELTLRHALKTDSVSFSTVSLKDSTGAQAYSDVVQIQSGGDSACVNTSVQASGTGGPAPTAGNTAPAATTTGGAPAPPATGPATRSGSSSGTQTEASSATRAGTASAAPAPSKSGNAAFKCSVGTYGLAGAMGLLGLAVL